MLFVKEVVKEKLHYKGLKESERKDKERIRSQHKQKMYIQRYVCGEGSKLTIDVNDKWQHLPYK